MRARAEIRRWSYRQRNLAAGVWFKLRRVLADARAAYVISGEVARALELEGYQPEACGLGIAPAKTILFVDEQRVRQLRDAREIRVGLGS